LCKDSAAAEAEKKPTYEEYEKFVRATGGKTGSDRDAVEASSDEPTSSNSAKQLNYVPPWQQDLLVPKGFKAAAFIRATGGTKGSDRGALEAATKEEDGAPAVFNAPIKYVPPWQQDQLNDYKPEKHERAQGGSNGGEFGGLGKLK
jgi:hypothetical protein